MKIRSHTLIFSITILSILLVPIIAVTYSYDWLSRVESGAGFVILLVAAGLTWAVSRRANRSACQAVLGSATSVATVLGLLWMVEIGINNILAPPLPARDIIDNVFWAVIALGLFILAVLRASRTASAFQGVQAGVWSGFVSGLLACCTALLLIVFGMRYIVRDSLNVAEWEARGAGSGAPTMAAYFAYETFAGALMHLAVLGVGMGGLLGVLGGLAGKGLYVLKAFFGRGGLPRRA